jgi:hypothetical protein
MQRHRFTKRHKYMYSVVAIAEDLAGTATGSGGDWTEDEEEKVAWLEWRMNKVWTPPSGSSFAPRVYDEAVRTMCLAALEMYKAWKKSATSALEEEDFNARQEEEDEELLRNLSDRSRDVAKQKGKGA